MRCPTKLQTISTKKQHGATNFRRAAKKIMRLKREWQPCQIALQAESNNRFKPFRGEMCGGGLKSLLRKNAAKFAVFIDVLCRNTCFCGII